MIDNIVIVRKDHKCEYCGETINKGEVAELHKGRAPVYDGEGGVQISIHYYRNYLHGYECGKPNRAELNISLSSVFDDD